MAYSFIINIKFLPNFYIYIKNIMAEYFKKKIIGKLSDKPIILKKIYPTQIVKEITPIEETIIPEEAIIPIEEAIIPIEEPIVSEEIIISEEITETPIEEVTIPEEIIIPIEEVVTPEEPKPKRTRKKK